MNRSNVITRTAGMMMNVSQIPVARVICYTLREFICDYLEDRDMWGAIVAECRKMDSDKWNKISYEPGNSKNPF